MSMKVNKNGKGYPVGVIPQSLYDDVEDLKEAVGNLKIFRKTINLQGVVLDSQDNGYNYKILTNQVPDGYYIIGVSLGGSFTCGLFCMPQVRSLVVFSNLSSITNNRPVYLYYAKATDV